MIRTFDKYLARAEHVLAGWLVILVAIPAFALIVSSLRLPLWPWQVVAWGLVVLEGLYAYYAAPRGRWDRD